MSVFKRGNIWHHDFWMRGQRFRGSTRQTTRARAEKMESLLINRVAEKGVGNLFGSPQRLQDVSARFLQWVENAGLATTTKQYYRDGWKLLEKTRLPKMRLDAINDEIDVVKFPAGPSNRNNALRTLRRIYSKAKEWELVYEIPRIKLAKEYGREKTYDDKTEQAIIARASQPLKDVFTITTDSGMRPWREAARIRWEDCDFTKRKIFIPDSKTREGRRFVPMSDRVYALLMARKPQKEGWVFPSPSKTGHLGSCKTAFKKLRRDLDLPKGLVLYSARHTFGTEVLKATGNLPAVMKVMGHKDIKTAMKYQHPQIDQQIVDVINKKSQQQSPQKSPQSDLVRKRKQAK